MTVTSSDAQVDETLFEFAPDAILVVGAGGKILRINPQAQQLFGYTSAEITGEPIEKLIPARFRERHVGLRDGYSEKPKARRMAASAELWAQRKDGTAFAVEVALGPQQTAGQGPLILCIVRDITDRRRAQEALQKAHDELEQRVVERTKELSVANVALERSNRELQDFAYVASHDLQEPLRKIQAFGERLKTETGNTLSETARDYLARMQNAASRMQTLIADLLSFSRVSTRAQPFQTISLDTIVREVLSDLEVRIEDCKARVDVPVPLGRIEADPMQMRQLFQNLIGNALKFRDPTRANTVTVKGEVLPSEDGGQTWYKLEVSDNGIGFEPKFAERIFGLFQRLHSRDQYEGSGVGLSICRKIAERHGGRMTASGKLGSGATFTVVIPTTHSPGAAL